MKGEPARRSRLVALSILLILSACVQEQPTGQVFARAGGEDVTRSDLAAEIAASGPFLDAEAAMRGPVLAKVIERRLLAQEARHHGLDRTPEYLAGVRRMRETLLVDLLRRQMQAKTPRPRPTEIAAFIRKHPWMFDLRQKIVIDRIAFDTASLNPARVAHLPDLNSIGVTLAGMRHPYRQDRVVVDTSTLTPRDAARLGTAEPGVVLPFLNNGTAAMVSVSAREAAPVGGLEAQRLAEVALRQEALDAAVGDALGGQQRATTVIYQTGYGPAAK